MTILYIFRRDFRLDDNNALNAALEYAKRNSGASHLEFKSLNSNPKRNSGVVPIFIFTPEQVGGIATVKSIKSIQCLIKGLEELNEELKNYNSRLHIFYDDNVKVLQAIHKKHKLTGIFEVKDYTPYAKLRTQSIKSFCEKEKIYYETVDDLYLTVPGSIRNKSNKIYQKFTYFYNEAIKYEVPKPSKLAKVAEFNNLVDNSGEVSLLEMKSLLLPDGETPLFYSGGRKEGLELLKDLSSLITNYNTTRDIMAVQTSGLSVHHHYGTVSIRETYHSAIRIAADGAAGAALSSGSGATEFIRQLYWRDFYAQIMYFFEELYGINPLNIESEWPALTNEQKRDFDNWKNGTTGIAIIDAAMNQLNTSGYMHNRGRLLTASYLVKTMGVPWRLGERYFANKLLDYDITQNMLNWMLVSSVKGLPFVEAPFRKHLPDSYRKRFDPDNEYIDFWS